MKPYYLLGIMAYSGLAACGPSATVQAPPSIDIAAVAKTSGSEQITFTIDPATGNPTYLSGTSAFQLTANTDLNQGTFIANARDSVQRLRSEGTYSAAEVRASGHGIAQVNGGNDAAVQTLYSHAGIALSAPNGTATSTGTYVGFFPHQDGFILRGSEGDVSLDVTFADGTVSLSGKITNRSTTGLRDGVRDSQLGPLSDLTLPTVTVAADGSFSSATSGGNINDGIAGQERVATGAFEGIVAGPDGTEVVGSISMSYVFPTGPLFEYGTFATGH